MIDKEVTQVLDGAPEFADRYLELVRSADGDPGASVVFAPEDGFDGLRVDPHPHLRDLGAHAPRK